MLRATGHARMVSCKPIARRAQHLRCSLRERSEQADNKYWISLQPTVIASRAPAPRAKLIQRIVDARRPFFQAPLCSGG